MDNSFDNLKQFIQREQGYCNDEKFVLDLSQLNSFNQVVQICNSDNQALLRILFLSKLCRDKNFFIFQDQLQNNENNSFQMRQQIPNSHQTNMFTQMKSIQIASIYNQIIEQIKLLCNLNDNQYQQHNKSEVYTFVQTTIIATLMQKIPILDDMIIKQIKDILEKAQINCHELQIKLQDSNQIEGQKKQFLDTKFLEKALQALQVNLVFYYFQENNLEKKSIIYNNEEDIGVLHILLLKNQFYILSNCKVNSLIKILSQFNFSQVSTTELELVKQFLSLAIMLKQVTEIKLEGKNKEEVALNEVPQEEIEESNNTLVNQFSQRLLEIIEREKDNQIDIEAKKLSIKSFLNIFSQEIVQKQKEKNQIAIQQLEKEVEFTLQYAKKYVEDMQQELISKDLMLSQIIKSPESSNLEKEKNLADQNYNSTLLKLESKQGTDKSEQIFLQDKSADPVMVSASINNATLTQLGKKSQEEQENDFNRTLQSNYKQLLENFKILQLETLTKQREQFALQFSEQNNLYKDYCQLQQQFESLKEQFQEQNKKLIELKCNSSQLDDNKSLQLEKQNLHPYLVFFIQNYQHICSVNPSLNQMELSQVMVKLWDKLSEINRFKLYLQFQNDSKWNWEEIEKLGLTESSLEEYLDIFNQIKEETQSLQQSQDNFISQLQQRLEKVSNTNTNTNTNINDANQSNIKGNSDMKQTDKAPSMKESELIEEVRKELKQMTEAIWNLKATERRETAVEQDKVRDQLQQKNDLINSQLSIIKLYEEEYSKLKEELVNANKNTLINNCSTQSYSLLPVKSPENIATNQLNSSSRQIVAQLDESNQNLLKQIVKSNVVQGINQDIRVNFSPYSDEAQLNLKQNLSQTSETILPELFQQNQSGLQLKQNMSQLELNPLPKGKILKTEPDSQFYLNSGYRVVNPQMSQSILEPTGQQIIQKLAPTHKSQIFTISNYPSPTTGKLIQGTPNHQISQKQYISTQVSLPQPGAHIQYVAQKYRLCARCKIMKKSNCFSIFPSLKETICRQCLDLEYEKKKSVSQSFVSKLSTGRSEQTVWNKKSHKFEGESNDNSCNNKNITDNDVNKDDEQEKMVIENCEFQCCFEKRDKEGQEQKYKQEQEQKKGQNRQEVKLQFKEQNIQNNFNSPLTVKKAYNLTKGSSNQQVNNSLNVSQTLMQTNSKGTQLKNKVNKFQY